MPGPLMAAAKVAIEELINKHTNQSKYGFFLSGDDYQDLVEDLLKFFENSRNLQASGSKFLKSKDMVATRVPHK